MDKREQLREIIKYQIEAYGGKINPKDDFNGFILDILALFPEPSVEEIEKIIFNEISGANFMADINMCKRLVRALSKFRIKREGEKTIQNSLCETCKIVRYCTARFSTMGIVNKCALYQPQEENK